MADRVVPVDVRAMVVAWPEDAPRGSVSRFCREHGVSRSWFYEVRARARDTDPLTAMRPRPRATTARHPRAIPVEVEELAVRVRKELADAGWDHGPVTVRHRLGELGLIAPAASTLARVFTRRGMVLAQPQKRPRSSYRRFEFATVHECWQLDAFQTTLADGSICAVYQVLDDRSRALLASHVTGTETAAGAITVIDKAIAAHQVPVLVLTDNGGAFNQTRRGLASQLVTHLQALGCRAITGRPGHPQTQGKDERVHQTTQRWRPPDPGRRPRPGCWPCSRTSTSSTTSTGRTSRWRCAPPPRSWPRSHTPCRRCRPSPPPPAPGDQCEPAAAGSPPTARSPSDTSRSNSATNTATAPSPSS